MSIPKTTQVYILAEPPVAEITASTFRLETRPLPSAEQLKPGEILLKAIAYSNDPAQRGWIEATQDPKRLYIPPVNKGSPMSVYSLIGEVLASNSDKWKCGMRVVSRGGWWEYGVVSEEQVLGEAVEFKGKSPYLSLSVFGLAGCTAYSGESPALFFATLATIQLLTDRGCAVDQACSASVN